MHTIAPYSTARLAHALQRGGYDWFSDGVGHLGLILGGLVVRLHQVGPEDQILQARVAWPRRADIEQQTELLSLLRDLNFERPDPKCYTRVLDDGTVVVVWETALPVQAGVSDSQLDAFLHNFASRSLSQNQKLAAAWPDPLRPNQRVAVAVVTDPAALPGPAVELPALPTAPEDVTEVTTDVDLAHLQRALRELDLHFGINDTGGLHGVVNNFPLEITHLPDAGIVRVAGQWPGELSDLVVSQLGLITNDWNRATVAPTLCYQTNKQRVLRAEFIIDVSAGAGAEQLRTWLTEALVAVISALESFGAVAISH
ncbi:hypothetical protein EII12_01045 [Buchananella hordeovulneris]|uniref:YbjN domain-containing protein n=1 Tax=Buchananella hordeovulneris TaxID=52770 RepID=UPI000F5D6E72|nr:YbjN domain-containing protein [Buchananella hordeovulneris]RRD53616.1 hypothetical protein EII12_01045 [Buchananella hordeovulneris]